MLPVCDTRAAGRSRVHRRVGDKGRALTRLGFPAMNKLPPDRVRIYKDHVARVFDRQGVRRRFTRKPPPSIARTTFPDLAPS